MNTIPRSPNSGRALVGIVVSAAFLWSLALSVSPQLHERIHPDANRADHTCAVTFIASGSYEHAAQPPLVSVPVPAAEFFEISAVNPCWVSSLFLGARIFEHAPPVLA